MFTVIHYLHVKCYNSQFSYRTIALNIIRNSLATENKTEIAQRRRTGEQSIGTTSSGKTLDADSV